ncbi:VCBS repeat-containing protein [Actinophytocola algeriensis]|uniref:VCBS repeat protein n=1 Tax=Actinophytocola algeriensis TaxID=1768010 RepID=A0A7W7QBM0_9PSEU|nr:VCBS repeat-containing protein [Actinophytocola algeriensis]MBB4910567.1 hypothetical protein [Actinophytocola algeriensis]MBE1480444.1 hypothetical protein [Actinophytocola algeriensis]
MNSQQRRPLTQLHRFVNVSLTIGLTFAVLVGTHQAAPAATSKPASTPASVTKLAPNDNIQRSTSRSRDVTGDAWPDIVAREPGINSGTLWVYRHTGSFSGTSTFAGRVLVGTGWNGHNWIGVAEVTGDTQDPELTPEAPADLLARRASDGALLVYPHSGTFNGTSTWRSPVLIGQGWNGFSELILADVTADGFDDILAYDGSNLWAYPHSRTFNGVNTFLPRVHVRSGSIGWLLATEWHRDTPDLISNSFATGTMTVARHLRDFDGTNTWAGTSTDVAAGLFTGSFINLLSLSDLNGNGTDDVIVRSKSGTLIAYPFMGVNGLNSFGEPATLGTGWQIMDLVT